MRRAPLLLALTLGAGSCGGSTGAPEGTGVNVVIVLVDQLRKDSMELWAPQITSLAEQGIVAGQMRSVAPWTYPSVITLLSGLYPQQHNADGDMFQNVLSTFDEAVPLLPAALRDAGYTTAAFITNPFLQTWNPLHLAFDSYDADFIGSQGNLRGKGKLVWRGEMFADTVNAAIREHFDAAPPSAPEFTYIHYIDVHGPWEDAPFDADYESAIRWMDGQVIEMYDYFMQRYDGDVIFVVTSDHGKALDDDETIGPGQRWRVGKKTVHDFNLRIPFVILPSKHVVGSLRFDVACSNVDVTPTLLDWLDIEPTWAMPGLSLMPLIRGEQTSLPSRALYSRNSAFKALNECIVYEDRKYLVHYSLRQHKPIATRVFDLVADPRETTSLDNDLGNARGVFEQAKGTHGLHYKGRYNEPSNETLKGLKSLGYMDGQQPSATDDDNR